MTIGDPFSAHPVQLYLLDDDFPEISVFRRRYPGAELHVFSTTATLLLHAQNNPVTSQPYVLATDVSLGNFQKHVSSTASSFSDIVTQKGACVETVHVLSAHGLLAREAAQQLHAAMPDIRIQAWDKFTDMNDPVWDSVTGYNPLLEQRAERGEQNRLAILHQKHKGLAEQLTRELNRIATLPLNRQTACLYDVTDQLTRLQVNIPAGTPSMSFEEGCGEPTTGHVVRHLEEALDNQARGRHSILVTGPFHENDLGSFKATGVVGLICLDPDAMKGHLSYRLGSLGVSAVVNVSEGDIGTLKTGAAVTLDPRNRRLAIGHHPVLSMADPVEPGQPDMRVAANAFLQYAKTVRDPNIHLPQRAINAGGLADIFIAQSFGLPIGLLRSEHFVMEHQEDRQRLEDLLLGPSGNRNLAGRFERACYGMSLAALAPAFGLPGVSWRLMDVSPTELFNGRELEEFRARYQAETGHLPRGVQLAHKNEPYYAAQISGLTAAFSSISAREGPPAANWLTIVVPNVEKPDDITFVKGLLDEAQGRFGPMPHRLGAMVENLEACSNITGIAPLVDHISIGSNDLTAEVLKLDRHDPAAIREFASRDPSRRNPFQTLNTDVTRTIQFAMLGALQANMNLTFSLCGNHAADLDSLLTLEDERFPRFRQLSVQPTFSNLLVTPLRHYRQQLVDARLT